VFYDPSLTPTPTFPHSGTLHECPRDARLGAGRPPCSEAARAARPVQNPESMSLYRKYLRVAGLVVGIVSPAAVPSLSAQGGGQARRASVARASEAAAREALIEPARSVLRNLVGRWRVEVRFAGISTARRCLGTRVVAALFDDLRLQWTEELDSSRVKSQGMIGFDSRTGRFYSTAVDSAGTGAELLTGTLDVAEPLIMFSPAAASPGGDFVLRMVDQDHFTWAPLDRGWRAVLTRER